MLPFAASSSVPMIVDGCTGALPTCFENELTSGWTCVYWDWYSLGTGPGVSSMGVSPFLRGKLVVVVVARAAPVDDVVGLEHEDKMPTETAMAPNRGQPSLLMVLIPINQV